MKSHQNAKGDWIQVRRPAIHLPLADSFLKMDQALFVLIAILSTLNILK